MFSQYEVLDADDIALTALARLRTPLWQLRRRRDGFDFVFIDETQLFNENERRLFALLVRGDKKYVPIGLAIDEAQELRGAVTSGFGLLGIESIVNEELRIVHRSSRGILELAFRVIQQTTDLFGANFLTSPGGRSQLFRNSIIWSRNLCWSRLQVARKRSGTSSSEMWRSLRAKGLHQVGVVVHAERYWEAVRASIQVAKLPVRTLTVRGELIDESESLVVLSQPEFVGGQEFDAVIAVGLEQGLVPPRIEGHPGLAATLEQQALREMYLSFTRARYQLVVANAFRSTPTALLTNAIEAGLLDVGT